jgi:hypothetical protein
MRFFDPEVKGILLLGNIDELLLGNTALNP